jgi:hypothetical protein
MTVADFGPDSPLTPEQELRAASLTRTQLQAINEALMSNISIHWRKVAQVVGTTMDEALLRKAGLPDVFFAQRIRKLVGSNKLEYQGTLENMRYSEVRLPR